MRVAVSLHRPRSATRIIKRKKEEERRKQREQRERDEIAVLQGGAIDSFFYARPRPPSTLSTRRCSRLTPPAHPSPTFHQKNSASAPSPPPRPRASPSPSSPATPTTRGPTSSFDAASSASALLRRSLDGERAHVAAVWAATHGLFTERRRPDPPALRVAAFGREFRNPLGLAAGFDKDAEGAEALLEPGVWVHRGRIDHPEAAARKPKAARVPRALAERPSSTATASTRRGTSPL